MPNWWKIWGIWLLLFIPWIGMITTKHPAFALLTGFIYGYAIMQVAWDLGKQ